FIAALPAQRSPEQTTDREGFIHPYVINGGVDEAVIQCLLRDFDSDELREQEQLLRELLQATCEARPGLQGELGITRQYRNMADGLKHEPRAVQLAVKAHQQLGRPVTLNAIRGGTDGSQFTERGLPTPNLSSGQHNMHSPHEWACLEEMTDALGIGLQLCALWARENRGD
ncbi:peptidase T, partial [Gammaproteobacteria bacterium]|nr:peptidase T [Gammaproteobacteria bacterium]